ncbi:MAG: hypothetical protein ACRD3B_11350 [Candidatus Sulfotelmatobacter sp.]
MVYLIGLVLALAVATLATAIGLDRGRAFYPTVLIVIASYYVLFAVMGASRHALIFEMLVASGFLLIALVGFKKNLWFVALATVGHGVFDFLHHLFVANPGVPSWWPGFCLAFDVVFGCFLAMRLITRALPLPDAR